MKFGLSVAFAMVTAVTLPPSARAADAQNGRAKSAECVSCHGQNGISPNPKWPNLAGQKEGYLLDALKDYKNGQRVHPIMTAVAKALSDDEIADLSAYYANLKSQ